MRAGDRCYAAPASRPTDLLLDTAPHRAEPSNGLLSRGASLVEQIDIITRDGLVLAPETVAAIGRAEARRNRWTVAALWAIAALLTVLIVAVW